MNISDKKYVLMGFGGHARVLLDAMLMMNWNIVGITDINLKKHGREIYGIPVIGDDKCIERYSTDEIYLVNGIGSVVLPRKRMDLYNKWVGLGYKFASVIHPSSIIARDVKIGKGTQIMAGVVIQTGTQIGANTIINTKASIDHDCKIGEHCHVAPGVVFSGCVEVADFCHIGTGAVIINGVKIEKGVLVAAGAAVVNDIAEGTAVKGVPARFFCLKERTSGYENGNSYNNN